MGLIRHGFLWSRILGAATFPPVTWSTVTPNGPAGPSGVGNYASGDKSCLWVPCPCHCPGWSWPPGLEKKASRREKWSHLPSCTRSMTGDSSCPGVFPLGTVVSSLSPMDSSPLPRALDHTHNRPGYYGAEHSWQKDRSPKVFFVLWLPKKTVSFQALLMDSLITFGSKYNLSHDTTPPYIPSVSGDLQGNQRISELGGTFHLRAANVFSSTFDLNIQPPLEYHQ